MELGKLASIRNAGAEHRSTGIRASNASTDLERAISRIAPAGKIEGIRMANRRMADAQGHFRNLAPGERAKLLKTK